MFFLIFFVVEHNKKLKTKPFPSMPPKKSKSNSKEKKVKSTGSVLCDNGEKPSVVAASGRRYCVGDNGSRKYIDPISAAKKSRPATPTIIVVKKEKKVATPTKKKTPVRRSSGAAAAAAAEPKKVVMTGAAFCVARDKFVDERRHEYCFDDNGDPVFTGRRNVSGVPFSALQPAQEKQKKQKSVVVHVHVPKADTPVVPMQKPVRVRASSPAPAPAPAPVPEVQVREKIVHVPQIQVVHVPAPVRQPAFNPSFNDPVRQPAFYNDPAPVPRQPDAPNWPKTMYAVEPTNAATTNASSTASARSPAVVRFNSQPQVQTYSVERNNSEFTSTSDSAQADSSDSDDTETDMDDLEYPFTLRGDDDRVVFSEIRADVPPPQAIKKPLSDNRSIFQRYLPRVLGGKDA